MLVPLKMNGKSFITDLTFFDGGVAGHCSIGAGPPLLPLLDVSPYHAPDERWNATVALPIGSATDSFVPIRGQVYRLTHRS